MDKDKTDKALEESDETMEQSYDEFLASFTSEQKEKMKKMVM
jgi:hypothetical protein